MSALQPSGATRSSVWRFATLLVCLRLLWPAPSGLCAPLGKEVREIRITMDVAQWRLEVPYGGRWSHWAMNNPSRIVIDLIDAHSCLLQAPALFTLELPGGPVSHLRTSQFCSDPGNRRVRISLILHEAVRYEVDKKAQRVDLRIPRPAAAQWGELWQVVIGPDGVRKELMREVAAEPDSSLAPPSAGEMAELQPTAAPPPEPVKPEAGTAEPDSSETITLESLLGDTTFFEVSRPRGRRAWDVAAARLLEDAQRSFLEDDTCTCLEKLQTCERFYAKTQAGRQATLLRHLLLRAWGRVVEADLGPVPPEEGPWPMLADAVLDRVLNNALIVGDLAFAEQLLSLWEQAEPDRSVWARAALRTAESFLDREDGGKATAWVRRGLKANPDLEVSARVLLLYATARMEERAWAEAESLLARVEASAEEGLLFRARAARADLRYRRKQFSAAAKLYERLLEEAAPSVEREWALYQLGNCWAAMGDLKRARAYLGRVIESPEEGFWAPFARMRLLELEENNHASTLD